MTMRSLACEKVRDEQEKLSKCTRANTPDRTRQNLVSAELTWILSSQIESPICPMVWLLDWNFF
jgi:hypothetical protein